MHVWTLWLWCEHTGRTFVPLCHYVILYTTSSVFVESIGFRALIAFSLSFIFCHPLVKLRSTKHTKRYGKGNELWGSVREMVKATIPGAARKMAACQCQGRSRHGTHCVQIMKLVVISNSNFFSNSKRISKSVFDHFCFNYHSRFPCWMHHVWPIILSDVSWLRAARSLPAWLIILIGAGHAWSQGKKHGSNKMLQVQRQPKLTRKSLKV